MPKEVELKLVLSAAAAETFVTSGVVAGNPTTRKMRAIYFDTPDHALRTAGISWRIRRSGGKRIQTIKGSDSQGAGLFARSEWEMPVPDDHPVLDNHALILGVLGEGAATLVPAFEVKVERLTWLVEEEAASIEVTLDRGAAIAGERQSPVCELELELKRGESDAVFALARHIAGTIAVRLGVVTKAERGYALLGPLLTAFKAERVRLDDVTSAEAFQAIAGLCIRHYRLNEILLLEGGEPEALHHARVALRRLRSALAIFRPLLVGEQVSHFHAELRRLTGILGDARDLDVLADKTPPGVLRDRLQTARDQASGNVGAALDSHRVRLLLIDLAEWLATGDWLTAPETRDLRDLPARRFAEEALRGLRRRVRKRGKSLATLSDEQRHDVRKAAKRLRYGAEFFASLFPTGKRARRYRRFAMSLEQLQDQLGMLADVATAPRVLERLGLLEQSGAEHLLAHRKKSKTLSAAKAAYSDLIGRKGFWS